ncbi:hypothetical protein [Kitasatospora sp. NPDC093806]
MLIIQRLPSNVQLDIAQACRKFEQDAPDGCLAAARPGTIAATGGHT